jgi:pyruvate ferredoxin oxidoreductase alpha subunit
MTVANRALGAPIKIWNDHSDALSQRDSGWIQLYAESNQEALDLHVQAFRLAESLSVPVMVCMDGFVLTHAFEQVDLPTQEQVDAFLPPFVPQQMLDPEDPVPIGAMVGPEAFAEVKYLMHAKQVMALDAIPEIAAEFADVFGRGSGGLVRPYRCEDAETIVVALGSVRGTIEEVVDGLRDEGVSIGVLGIGCSRPWPIGEVREALSHARRVIVVEKAFAVGAGGIVGQNTRDATRDLPVEVYDVVAGLGGRPITRASLRRIFDDVLAGRLDPKQLHFLDLDFALVQRELKRSAQGRRPGPHAEHMLRDIGTVASGAYE